ncbi:MAG: thymidine kinase [Gordonia sp. (in: high G+C Gram-positive bacteria)]
MRTPGRLAFYYGPMGAGKSTSALQTHFNQVQQDRRGVLVTQRDRSGKALVTSRIGLAAEALLIEATTDLTELIVGAGTARIVDFAVCDEAQFLSPRQVDQLAGLADDHGVDVFAYGLLTDFRSVLFPGSARLVELADELHRLQAVVLCWCGRAALLNARVVDGRVARTGEVVAVGDTQEAPVRYQALCRRHHIEGRTRGHAAGEAKGL